MEEKSEQTEKPHFFKNSLGVYFNETCFLLKSKSPVFFWKFPHPSIVQLSNLLHVRLLIFKQ